MIITAATGIKKSIAPRFAVEFSPLHLLYNIFVQHQA